MSEAKVGFSANVWVEVVGLFMVALDFVNAFGFVPLHVLKPAMRINVSINMLFGIAACYSRESAPAMPTTSGATRLSICFALEMPPRNSRARAQSCVIQARPHFSSDIVCRDTTRARARVEWCVWLKGLRMPIAP